MLVKETTYFKLAGTCCDCNEPILITDDKGEIDGKLACKVCADEHTISMHTVGMHEVGGKHSMRKSCHRSLGGDLQEIGWFDLIKFPQRSWKKHRAKQYK